MIKIRDLNERRVLETRRKGIAIMCETEE